MADCAVLRPLRCHSLTGFNAEPLRFRRLNPTWNREGNSGIFGRGMISAPVHLG
jgi:hypothetical protein